MLPEPYVDLSKRVRVRANRTADLPIPLRDPLEGLR